jgi:hypothetical protein
VGTFKRLKDMKDMINAAPGMVQQAQEISAQAQQYAQAQQAAVQAQYGAQTQMGQFGGLPGTQPDATDATAATGPDFDPIAGVSLEDFAAVSKGVAAYNYDGTKLPEIAASRGIPADSWAAASTGWNARVHANPLVAKRFNQLYRES